jgi:amino acid adenylation domain-containing protein
MAPDDASTLPPGKRALLEQRLQRSRASPTGPYPALPRPRRSGPAPLSPAQEQLWYFTRLAPENPVYNEAVSIRKDGRFEVDAFRGAFNEIVQRHEIWRTTFHELDGAVVQVVGETLPLELPVLDLESTAPPAREREAVRLVAREARLPYDLEHGPLLRPLLMRFGEHHHRLYLCLHHLIFDGVSLYRVVLPELVTLYEDFSAGRTPTLPAPAVQYADYSSELRERGDRPEHARRVGYWRRRLNGAAALQLPLDRPRPVRRRFRGAVEPLRIPKELVDELRSLSQAAGVTLFQVLAAGFTVLLHRYTEQDDIVFGTLVDMRESRELEAMVGYCLTALVVRADVRDDPGFTDLLSRIRNDVVDGLSNLVPFERLVRELHPLREAGVNPLFQVAVVLEPSTVCGDLTWSLHQMEAAVGDAVGNAKFDLAFELDERREGHIDGRAIYDSDLFEAETVACMAGHLITVLEGVVAEPDRPISELPLLSEEQRRQQLVEWNASSTEYPRDACLHELVTAQAQRSPDAIAAVFGEEQLSYRELDERANLLAGWLALENPHRDLVALYLERSLEMLVGMLAILKSGAAYLPLDPGHPPQRLSLMLQDSGAATLLTSSRLLPALQHLPAKVVCIDEDPPRDALRAVPLRPATAEEPAYVIYTSGSTGSPKGVCISHRSVVNLLNSLAREPGMTARDTIIAITTYAFDIAATELWLPLITGARVVIATADEAADGRRLIALLERSEVTIMQATPATWQMIVDAGWRGHPELVALSGGETLPPRLAASLLDRTACVWNMYGPTETTVWSTAERVERGAPISIGRPLANTRTYVLNRSRQPVPVGVTGELAIAGDGVGLGYLNRGELTAARFVPDPFVEGERMYLTGDRTRYRPDGRIEHLGRIDDQLKVHGFRVEPGEIEAALTAAPEIAAAVVVARGQRLAEQRLIAYVVPAGAPPRPSDLRRRLHATLPAYMVPSLFVAVDALPVSANGKIDRGALPEPRNTRDQREAAYAAPRNATERRMAAIWTRILGVDDVGVHDDFFDLGGHSLLALRLLVEVEQEFGVEIPLSTFIEDLSIDVAGVVAKLDTLREGGTSGTSLRPSEDTSPTLFFVNPSELTMVALRHFAGSEYRLVGLLPEGVADGFDGSQSIEALGGPMLDAIRATQPAGPYFLAGYSLGGVLAYELAGCLRAAGEQVAWLGLLDAGTPAWLRKELSLRQLAIRLRRRGPRWALAKVDEVARGRLAARRRRSPSRQAESEPFDLMGAARLIARYACVPHDADLDLFVTDSTAAATDSGSLGWDVLHGGAVRVHRVPGDHNAMMRAGSVNIVAEMVSAGLKEARRGLDGH